MTQQPKKKQDEKGRSADQVADDIIAESGNNFHCKVANYFRAKKWTTRISQFYVDATTDKAREIDLVAEKVERIVSPYQSKPLRIHTRLFIECKYITKPMVFWFEEIDKESALKLVESKTPLKRDNEHIKHHHYFNSDGDVAKLFASERSKGEDTEPFFRALHQCLNGFVHTRGESIVHVKYNVSDRLVLLTYPMIVCSSFQDFRRTNISGNITHEPIQDNFLLEVNYAYPNALGKSVSEYLIVDVAAFDRLDAFLAKLVKEEEAVKVIS